MDYDVLNAIEQRKSVRNYDGKRLPDEIVTKLRSFLKDADNPFAVKVDLRYLDAGEFNLSSPFVTGEKAYVTGTVHTVPFAEIAFGYTMESFVLYAQRLGLGTVWLEYITKRESLEKALHKGENQLLPCVVAVGGKADRRSVREILIRKKVKADSRLDFEDIFFASDFSSPLKENRAGDFLIPLKMLRLAPSAANRQPWRVVVNGGYAHFYEKKEKKFDRAGVDLQKIDLGIAMCHFDLAVKACGMSGEFIVKVPGIAHESDTEYLISYAAEKLKR